MADPVAIKANLRSAFRDYQVDGVPGSGLNEPVKSEVRSALAATIDYVSEVASSAAAGRRAFATLVARNAWADRPIGAIASVQETGLDYRWDGTTWAVWTDPLVSAADRAESAEAGSVSAKDDALAAVAQVQEVVRPGEAPVVAALTDKDGRALLAVLDDGTNEFPLDNPWLTRRLDEAAGALSGARVLVFGDSRVDFCSDGLITNSIGWLYWLQLETGARFDFQPDSNFGLGGDDTAEGLARMTGVLTDPADIAIMLLSVNDRQGGRDFAWTIANLTEILSRFRAARKRLIIVAECPWGDAAHPDYVFGAQQVAYHLRVREWLLARHDPPWVYVADPFPDMVDPTSASAIALPGMHKDGGHLAALGNRIVAQKLAPIINTLLPPRPRLPASNADQFSADNPNGALNANPMLVGSTGGLATGWTASAAPTGVTVTLSKVTIDGEEWQKVELSGAASTSSVVVALNCALDVGDLSPGDVLEAVAEIHVEDATGIRGVPLRLLATYPTLSSVNASAGHAASTDSIAPPAPWGGIALTPRMTIQSETPSAVSLAVLAYLVQGAATTAVYRFRAVAVRKSFED